jgi:hypothetical protein
MMNELSEQEELNKVLDEEKCGKFTNINKQPLRPKETPAETESSSTTHPTADYFQWTTSDNKIFFPASKSCSSLLPGLYEIDVSSASGLFFRKLLVNNEDLVRFKDSNVDKAVSDIETFWNREQYFNEYSLTFKRGILLWGPPGTGKTCLVRLIVDDVVSRGGVVFNFTQPEYINRGFRIFRTIQPNTPCVIMLEDLDSILETYNESSVINILDGVTKLDKVVFLATTNYPERLGARIVNRPSRFDRRYKIGFLNEESRKIYFENLFRKKPELQQGHDIARWAADTDALSISHLKELFISVIILGESYEQSLKTLRTMKDSLSSSGDAKIGFGK